MSVDLDWESLTGGPDGDALASTVREFLHERFQKVEWPRLMRNVRVVDFHFGNVAPQITIKDIGDPLGHFYEDSSSDEDEADNEDAEDVGKNAKSEQQQLHDSLAAVAAADHEQTPKRPQLVKRPSVSQSEPVLAQKVSANSLDGQNESLHDQLDEPIDDDPNRSIRRSRNSGRPAANSYFNQPVHGSTTPFSPFAGPGLHNHHSYWSMDHHFLLRNYLDSSQTGPTGSHQTAANNAAAVAAAAQRRSRGNTGSSATAQPLGAASMLRRAAAGNSARQAYEKPSALPDPEPSLHQSRHEYTSNPNDIQITARVSYTGDVRISITAEIMLDYPMPSFVDIPIQLTVTGVSFDGVAIVAYMSGTSITESTENGKRKEKDRKVHVCVLSPADAAALLGDENDSPPPFTSSPINQSDGELSASLNAFSLSKHHTHQSRPSAFQTSHSGLGNYVSSNQPLNSGSGVQQQHGTPSRQESPTASPRANSPAASIRSAAAFGTAAGSNGPPPAYDVHHLHRHANNTQTHHHRQPYQQTHPFPSLPEKDREATPGMLFKDIKVESWIGPRLSNTPTGSATSMPQHQSSSENQSPFDEVDPHQTSASGNPQQHQQALKNVGAVEKFVREQVRKIFDAEFVYPSFWTFLV